MNSELTVIAIILAALAFNYLWLYPKIAGDDVKKMATYDAILSLVVFGIIALIFMGSDEVFNLFWIETNWVIYTIAVGVALEFPLFFYYIKARGLGAKYREMTFGTKGSWYGEANPKSVQKQLNDTKWDGLRTPSAKKFLVIAANLVILLGTIFLVRVEDSPWASYFIIHVILILSFWFLLRQSVRLVADAPDQALDERLIADRNQSYLYAYRWLAALSYLSVSGLLIFAIMSDARNETAAEFYYNLEISWPQIQAAFWLIFAYTNMLPSMVLAWKQSKQRVVLN